jgi:hypothetical protein
MKIATIGKFWLDDTVAPEEAGAIRPYLEKHHALIPPWCESIHVACLVNDAENVGCTCQIKTEEEYRRAHLTVFAAWLGEPPEYREQAIVHELLHLYTERQRVFAADLIRLYGAENPAMRSHLFEQLRKANEATTEDLTLMLTRIARQ